jgi:signal transduction histidine kinase
MPATLYLVDDQPAALELLVRRLEPFGHTVVTFTDGRRALDAARSTPPDLFLLDVCMPGIDGYELCDLIKAEEALRDIPVIFVSGASDLEAKLSAFDHGGVDYVTKPFEFREVLARVHAQLELHQNRRALLEAKITAELAGMAKDRFIASVSHELRTPLNAVLGMAEVLLDGTFGDLNDKQRAYLDFILHSGNHLLRQVNDLLELANLDFGAVALDRAPIALINSIYWVSGCLGANLVRKKQHIDLPPPRQVGMVLADEARLRQVLLNLVGNAIENTPEGGLITVRTESDVEAGMARVEVEDNGPGVPPEYRSEIFLEFRRGLADSRPAYQGAGLGLAIARRLVRLHGGAIGVGDRADGGQGSVFWFTLPLAGSDLLESSGL